MLRICELFLTLVRGTVTSRMKDFCYLLICIDERNIDIKRFHFVLENIVNFFPHYLKKIKA